MIVGHELKIVKNTLPYIQPYSIYIIIYEMGIGASEPKAIGHYKTMNIAETAKLEFEKSLDKGVVPAEFYTNSSGNKKITALEALKKRILNPDGDTPSKRCDSKKRKIILD